MIPKFSIIIPVYNVAPYLHECLDSVLAQTFTNWEAICVDDGSTDGSSVILDEYAAKDKRFRVIHQKNMGVSAARNTGLDASNGEWIWFIDSDDTIRSYALQKFDSLQRKADITYFGVEQRYNSGLKVSKTFESIEFIHLSEGTFHNIARLFDNELHDDLFGWTCNKFIRKEIIDRGRLRFDTEVSFVEDELFAMDLFDHAKSFGYIDAIFYEYHYVPSSLSNSPKRFKMYELLGDKFVQKMQNSKWLCLREFALISAVQWYLSTIEIDLTRFRAADKLMKLVRDSNFEIHHLTHCMLSERKLALLRVVAKLPNSVGACCLLLLFGIRTVKLLLRRK